MTKFLKDNFVLVVGLTLPILLMIGFIVFSTLPRSLSNPPQHDLIFATPDYSGGNANPPVTVALVVRDGLLKAQYTRLAPAPNGAYAGTGWKKLYRYLAGPQTVRELTFGIPQDVASIEQMREDTVDATKDPRCRIQSRRSRRAVSGSLHRTVLAIARGDCLQRFGWSATRISIRIAFVTSEQTTNTALD